MPSNPHKRRCELAGCRAWARHGQTLCAAHLRAHAVQESALAIGPLLECAHRAADVPAAGLDTLQLLDQELRTLFVARKAFLAWLTTHPDGASVSPAQFLRAWNESTQRVVQLLRARRDLTPVSEETLGGLLDNTYDKVEAELPLFAGLRPRLE